MTIEQDPLIILPPSKDTLAEPSEGDERHWSSYYEDQFPETDSERTLLHENQLQLAALTDVVFGGDIKIFATHHPGVTKTFHKNTREKISTVHGAANELYLKLGPLNELHHGEMILSVIAARQLNGIFGEDFIPQENFDKAWQQETSHKESGTPYEKLPALLRNVLDPLLDKRDNPVKQTIESRLLENPEDVTLLFDTLNDYYRLLEKSSSDQARGAQRAILSGGMQLKRLVSAAAEPRLKELRNENISFNDLDQLDKDLITSVVQVNNLAYDMYFTETSKGQHGIDDFKEKVFDDYIRNTYRLMEMLPTGLMLEVFVPFMARYSALWDGTINNILYRHTTTRSDAPHNGRRTKKRSSDLIVSNKTGDVRFVQLKNRVEPQHHQDYDPNTIDLFDGGFEEIAREYLPNNSELSRNYQHTEITNINRFQNNLCRALVGYIAQVELKGTPTSDKIKFAREMLAQDYGIKSKEQLNDINISLQAICSRELSPLLVK